MVSVMTSQRLNRWRNNLLSLLPSKTIRVVLIKRPSEPNFAGVEPYKCLLGVRRILLGADMPLARSMFKRGSARDWVYKTTKAKTADRLIEERIESALTHETLHILCCQFADPGEKLHAGSGIDLVDRILEVSG